MDPQLPQIIQYIDQQRAAGQPDAAIRTQLLATGWPEVTVTAAFGQTTSGPAALSLPTVSPAGAASPTLAASAPGLVAQPAVRGQRNTKKLVFISIAVLIVVILAVSAAVIASSKSRGVRPSGAASADTSSQNGARSADVAAVAAAVSKFKSMYTNAQPASTTSDGDHTIDLCGGDCKTQKLSVKLSHYSADTKTIRVVPYLSDLQVPDADKLYLVPDATCKAGGNGIGAFADKSAHSMALLYALSDGAVIQQQCKAV